MRIIVASAKNWPQSSKQRLAAALEAVRRNPETWRRLDEKYQRKLLKQFPYGLIYHQTDLDCIEIVAVMHLNREPDYWRGRGA